MMIDPRLAEKWVAPFMKWLLKQPAQSVMLFIIVVGGGGATLWQTPRLVEYGVSRMEAAFERLEKSQDKLAISFDKAHERDAQFRKEQQQFIEKFLTRPQLQGRKNNQEIANAPL